MLVAIEPLDRSEDQSSRLVSHYHIIDEGTDDHEGQGNKKTRQTQTLTKMDEDQEKLFDLFQMNATLQFRGMK